MSRLSLRLGRGKSSKSSNKLSSVEDIPVIGSSNTTTKAKEPALLDHSETSATSIDLEVTPVKERKVLLGSRSPPSAVPPSPPITTDVFKKKARDQSSRNKNSNHNPFFLEDHEDDDYDDNCGKKHWKEQRDCSLTTIRTSNKKQDLDLDRWHNLLVSSEQQRKQAATAQLQAYQDELQAVQQLVEHSCQETVTAARWVTGIAKAEEQLLRALELGESKDNGDDDHADDELLDDSFESSNNNNNNNNNNHAKDEFFGLPEKKKEDESVDDTNAAVIPMSSSTASNSGGDEPDNNHDERPLLQSKSSSNVNNSNDPPIASLTIPSQTARSYEPVTILFKQHNLLHQSLLTMLDTRKTAHKVQELKKTMLEQVQVLDQQAHLVFKDMQSQELEVEIAWSESYDMLFIIRTSKEIPLLFAQPLLLLFFHSYTQQTLTSLLLKPCSKPTREIHRIIPAATLLTTATATTNNTIQQATCGWPNWPTAPPSPAKRRAPRAPSSKPF